MKNNAGKTLMLLLLISSSCSSIHKFSVDVQEPALVTLPVSAQNVLILNNTVIQPKDYGIERTLDGQPIPTDYPLSLDSMVWSAMDEIAGVLDESHFFNTLATYRKPLRSDSDAEWLSIVKLSPDVQSDFYATENYDALLVINRLLFSVKENVKKIPSSIFSSDPIASVELRADGILTCSMYSYRKERALTTFTISDSLLANSMVICDSTVLFKEIPELVLDELSHKIGNQAANHFIPTWKTSERILFTGRNARMQEATGYAADHQWAKAEAIWITESEKKTKPADKAKIAFNLAVADEMQDKFESAAAWAQKAKEYFENANLNNNSKEITLIDQYITDLEKRIQDNRLLDLQWGKEQKEKSR